MIFLILILLPLSVFFCAILVADKIERRKKKQNSIRKFFATHVTEVFMDSATFGLVGLVVLAIIFIIVLAKT